MKNIIACLLVAILFSSCEKSVTFKLDDTTPALVVDATIENGEPPMVMLSSSLNFFSEISPQILLNSFVRGAAITISDGSREQMLKEYSYKVGGIVDIYYYTTDSTLPNRFVGELNKSYTMTIKVGGNSYTASTSIPSMAKRVDSLWWRKSPNNPDSSQVIVMSRITDPPGYGNYIRYFTRTGNGPYLPGLNSVFDDQIIDGTSYDIEVEKGVDRNTEIDFENYSFFNKGDTVSIKFTNINKTTYDFWRTMEYGYASIGNPFSTPTRVLGNISGGALGYLGGYAVQYKTLIIPR